jgi:hypothetical protein
LGAARRSARNIPFLANQKGLSEAHLAASAPPFPFFVAESP